MDKDLLEGSRFLLLANLKPTCISISDGAGYIVASSLLVMVIHNNLSVYLHSSQKWNAQLIKKWGPRDEQRCLLVKHCVKLEIHLGRSILQSSKLQDNQGSILSCLAGESCRAQGELAFVLKLEKIGNPPATTSHLAKCL